MRLPERMSDFALHRIRKAARLSHDVYDHVNDFSHNAFKDMLKIRLVHGRGASLVAIAESESSIYVVFRGTDFSDRSQVMSDVKISTIDEPHVGLVATGFRQELDYFYNEVFSAVKNKVMYVRKPCYITGHSLGGALASLCAARMSLYGLQTMDPSYVPSGLITFGCPRVGDADFAKHLEVTLQQMDSDNPKRIGIWRFRNNNDIVTRVPTVLRGYRHAGKCVYISPSGDFHENPWWHRRFWWGVVGAGLRFFSDQFEDHRMIHYLSKVTHVASTRGL